MIYDSHIHLPGDGWSNEPWRGLDTADDSVRYLKAMGITGAVFTTWRGVLAETADELDRGNAAALELARQYPDFLYPGVSLHPAFPEATERWLPRFRELGCRWVGELVFSQKPFRYIDDSFMALAEACANGGWILQLHVHEDIAAVARRFPAMPIVCSHISPTHCPALAAEPNIWLDISGRCGGLYPGGIESALAAFGPDRLLFGSDFTGYDPRCFLARLAFAVPDPATREKILWRNLARLMESAGAAMPG